MLFCAALTLLFGLFLYWRFVWEATHFLVRLTWYNLILLFMSLSLGRWCFLSHSTRSSIMTFSFFGTRSLSLCRSLITCIWLCMTRLLPLSFLIYRILRTIVYCHAFSKQVFIRLSHSLLWTLFFHFLLSNFEFYLLLLLRTTAMLFTLSFLLFCVATMFWNWTYSLLTFNIISIFICTCCIKHILLIQLCIIFFLLNLLQLLNSLVRLSIDLT